MCLFFYDFCKNFFRTQKKQTMSKVHNYSAGPCILPQEVFEEASKAVLNYNDSGLSILEMSHRSKDFVAVMDEARALVKEILEVPDGYTVLILTRRCKSWIFSGCL